MTRVRAGMLLFPELTQLDLTGPFEVFSRAPGFAVDLVWKTRDPVRADTGITILPNEIFAHAPAYDLLCVPGGPGIAPLLEDEAVLGFLRAQAATARYVTSVCTGALVLAAAGLLRGKRATTHWASHEFLGRLGAQPVNGRVVRDGRFITGGGVTAGIDFALTVVAEIAGQEAAESIQLQIEYAPEPPFEGGTPDRASPAVLAAAMARLAGLRETREPLIARVAGRIAAMPPEGVPSAAA